ncbi:hypothetical protein NDU88_007751 [Pleurodeles waltl]|uniref:CRIB domain-containing protein n=1 Tax=Pleurodeles waltl TaxID=8319 RepID=A0AAV7N4J6_PLEWA|nr:hypothetical protein NDU88_007751 [Pleurodeles waltl]
MEIFQLIGSMFQTSSQLPDNSMTQDKNVSLPGGNLQSGSWAGTLLFDGRAGGSKISKEDIGAPCDFKHVAHIGWESRFATYIVNSDTQILFSRAGIGEEHLKDRRTSKRIFEILERKGGMEAVRQEALSLALSDESRSINSSELSAADNSGDAMSASVLPTLQLTHCSSINSLPPPQSLPSFDNAEVASDHIPPPPALECCTSYSARFSTDPPCNRDVMDSVQIQPPPLSNSLGCLAVDSVPMIPPPPPPPPLPFVKNQTSVGSLTLPHPPPFSNCPLVEPPNPLPLAPAEQNAFSVDKCLHSTHHCSICLSPPSSPPYIPSFPVDSSTRFPSPLDDLQSDNPRLFPRPLNPTQAERSGCPKEKSETASEKQMDQPGLLEQIRRGMVLKAVHVDVKVTGVKDTSSRPPTENNGIVSALMDVIQKRHLACQISYDELESDEGWDD